MANTTFGMRLNAALRAQRISNQELARRLGVDGSAVRRWRRGEVDPTYSTMERIAGALGITLVELVSAEPAEGLEASAAAPAPEISKARDLAESIAGREDERSQRTPRRRGRQAP